MAQLYLRDLYNQFLKETTLIIGCFYTQIPRGTRYESSCEIAHQRAREMCVIALQDAWSRYCRELIIQSAACKPITINGILVGRARGITNRNQVLPIVRGFFGRSGSWEPKWYNPADCLSIARQLGVSNYSDISGGLAITPSPLEDLRKVRNFFAHKSEKTANEVKTVAITLRLPRTTSALKVVEQIVPPGVSIFEQWVSDIQVMAGLAAS